MHAGTASARSNRIPRGCSVGGGDDDGRWIVRVGMRLKGGIEDRGTGWSPQPRALIRACTIAAISQL